MEEDWRVCSAGIAENIEISITHRYFVHFVAVAKRSVPVYRSMLVGLPALRMRKRKRKSIPTTRTMKTHCSHMKIPQWLGTALAETVQAAETGTLESNAPSVSCGSQTKRLKIRTTKVKTPAIWNMMNASPLSTTTTMRDLRGILVASFPATHPNIRKKADGWIARSKNTCSTNTPRAIDTRHTR